MYSSFPITHREQLICNIQYTQTRVTLGWDCSLKYKSKKISFMFCTGQGYALNQTLWKSVISLPGKAARRAQINAASHQGTLFASHPASFRHSTG